MDEISRQIEEENLGFSQRKKGKNGRGTTSIYSSLCSKSLSVKITVLSPVLSTLTSEFFPQ